MEVRSIATTDELSMAIAFFIETFPDLRGLYTDDGSPYTYAAWEQHMSEYPSLLITAFEDDRTIGAAWGRVEGTSVTVGPVAVDAGQRGRGIGYLLLRELEERCLKLGVYTLCLGAVEEAEGFYLKCGYQPYLLVQAKVPVTLDELRGENTVYAEAWTYEDETDVRLCLRTPVIDKQLQRRYDAAFPGCGTQVMFFKSLADPDAG